VSERAHRRPVVAVGTLRGTAAAWLSLRAATAAWLALRGPAAAWLALAAVLLVLAPPPPSANALEPGPTPSIAGPSPGWPRPIGMEATAFVLLDTSTGQVLAERSAEQRRPVASTVKVLTALTALERVDLDEQVTVGEEVAGVPGSGVGLEPGDTWSVQELVDGIIARSGNEAAEALAVHVAGSRDAFLRLMEEDAAAIGVQGLELVSVSGLDDDNLLSAMDLALISQAALDHDVLGPILAQRQVTIPGEGTVTSRNLLLASYPEATGVKTGFTTAAGNSLIGSAAREDRELIAVILDAGDDPGRFEAAGRLLDLGFDAYSLRELSADLRFAVAGGQLRVVVDEVQLVLPRAQDAGLQLPIGARPPDRDTRVPVLVDGTEVTHVPAVLDRSRAPRPAGSAEADLGRAAVDGIYAALRARAASDAVG